MGRGWGAGGGTAFHLRPGGEGGYGGCTTTAPRDRTRQEGRCESSWMLSTRIQPLQRLDPALLRGGGRALHPFPLGCRHHPANSDIATSAHQTPQHHHPHAPPRLKQSITLIPMDAGTDGFSIESPFLHTQRPPAPAVPLLGGCYPLNPAPAPTTCLPGSAAAPAPGSTLPTSQPFAAHPPPLPSPAFGCLKCICSTISAAIFHPSVIRHLHVHSTQKITYKQQLPPADSPPSPYQLLTLSQRQPPLWCCFCLRFFSPTPPFGVGLFCFFYPRPAS